jgi:phosphatidylglycerol lysyltransferase
MKKIRLKFLIPVFALTLFGGALWILHRTLSEFHYHDILRQLHALQNWQIAAALGLTALSYLVMTGYDWLAILYVQHPLKTSQILLT